VDYFEPEIVSLKHSSGIDEMWLQDRIAENPKVLGLGDLVLRDRERIQPNAGRLDLLLQDSETLRRYEVEIQLGKTDESHIIRTVEYWDIERRRYPQYDHCAVIVAEDITSRFLNVISLFNGHIPLVAIKLQAVQVGNEIGLIFTTVLDELPLGLPEEDETVQELTDRDYWEAKGSDETVGLADRLVTLIQPFAPGFGLKYNKHYIGLAKNNRANNFVQFRPRKTALIFEVRMPKSDEISQRLDEAGLEILAYDRHFGYYRTRVSAEDVSEHEDLLVSLMHEAFGG
jgi:hypothetical protein